MEANVTSISAFCVDYFILALFFCCWALPNRRRLLNLNQNDHTCVRSCTIMTKYSDSSLLQSISFYASMRRIIHPIKVSVCEFVRFSFSLYFHSHSCSYGSLSLLHKTELENINQKQQQKKRTTKNNKKLLCDGMCLI